MELRNFHRQHHLYSTGRPSRWASAHIVVFYAFEWYMANLTKDFDKIISATKINAGWQIETWVLGDRTKVIICVMMPYLTQCNIMSKSKTDQCVQQECWPATLLLLLLLQTEQTETDTQQLASTQHSNVQTRISVCTSTHTNNYTNCSLYTEKNRNQSICSCISQRSKTAKIKV